MCHATLAHTQTVFFPEAADYIAEGKAQSLALAQPLSGPFVHAIRQAAQAHGVWVSIGVHERVRSRAHRCGTRC
jgi:predicted amidohydrolase